MSRTYHCDVCKKEITTEDNLPSLYLTAVLGDGVEAVAHIQGIMNNLGWEMDICAACHRKFVRQAIWVDPAEKKKGEQK